MGSKPTYLASGCVAKISSRVWPMLAPMSTNIGRLPCTSLLNTLTFHEPAHLKWLRISFRLTPEPPRGIFMLRPRRFTGRHRGRLIRRQTGFANLARRVVNRYFRPGFGGCSAAPAAAPTPLAESSAEEFSRTFLRFMFLLRLLVQ